MVLEKIKKKAKHMSQKVKRSKKGDVEPMWIFHDLYTLKDGTVVGKLGSMSYILGKAEGKEEVKILTRGYHYINIVGRGRGYKYEIGSKEGEKKLPVNRMQINIASHIKEVIKKDRGEFMKKEIEKVLDKYLNEEIELFRN